MRPRWQEIGPITGIARLGDSSGRRARRRARSTPSSGSALLSSLEYRNCAIRPRITHLACMPSLRCTSHGDAGIQFDACGVSVT